MYNASVDCRGTRTNQPKGLCIMPPRSICSECGFILKDRGTIAEFNTYIPEEIRLLKDDIRFAVECLKIAVENTQELLSDHDERFGRDTRKNKLTAERLESEISDLKVAVEKLSK